jgi:uracil-DNA glycosylase family 4
VVGHESRTLHPVRPRDCRASSDLRSSSKPRPGVHRRMPRRGACSVQAMDRLSEVDALYDEIFAHYRSRDPELVRRRIVPEALESDVMLLGQALGRDTQRLSGLPFCFPPPERPRLSKGGRELDRFLARFGYTILPGGRGRYAHHTDLVHYFPGRNRRGSGDMRPPRDEVARSRRWLEAEVRLIRPVIVIALGVHPASVFLERYGGPRIKRLIDIAGVPIACRVAGMDVQMIAVHHPSGAFQHRSAAETYEHAAAHVRQLLRS